MLPFEIEKNLDALRALVEKGGVELIEIAFRRVGNRSVLTITADKEGGITLDDCTGINREVGDFLDQIYAEDAPAAVVGGGFDLEVVSPGLDRPLKTAKDFSRTLGERVRMTFKKEGESVATWTGKVLAVTADGIEIQLKDGARKTIALEKVVHAQREIEINKGKTL